MGTVPLVTDDEEADLIGLARLLSMHAEAYHEVFENLIAELRCGFHRAKNPMEFERAAEDGARLLRRLWLEASESTTLRTYRSPPAEEWTTSALGQHILFGYERDLHPVTLEDRCARCFGLPPRGWSADHILLSSGQSAMAAALHVLETSTLYNVDRKLTFAHLGSYFETAEIFSLFRTLLKCAGRGRGAVETMNAIDADVYIIEPIYCDGEFGFVDLNRLIHEHERRRVCARVYLIDQTVVGSAFELEAKLEEMREVQPMAVFRLVSGLKLFQAGLELANVGLLSVFTSDGSPCPAAEIGCRIRKIRTLLGLGLRFAEVSALEAPWFLDRSYTENYQKSIFANNALLAQAVAAENHLFEGAFHPSLLPGNPEIGSAPFCAFRLREHKECYGLLENYLLSESQRRGLHFEHGGSFGFRGHRFEVVRPEDGTEPFLRVALGKRTGWSRDQIIELMTNVSRAPDVLQLAS
jgi:hypothetical protein